MRLGVFFEVPIAGGQTVANRYADTLDQVRLAERLGFDTVWLAEHHFHGPGSALPNPWILAGAIAVSTNRIGIGTAVSILPLHQPLRLAAEVAMVDALSGGRALLGVGRGSSRYDGPPLGVPPDEVDARYEQGLELIERAWSADGVHWGGRDVVISPRPARPPGPPILVGARTAGSVARAAGRGYGLLMDVSALPVETVSEHAARYRDGFAPARGRGPFVGLLVIVRPGGRAHGDFYLSVEHYLRCRADATDPRDWARHASALVGEPAAVASAAGELAERCGIDELICWLDPGGLVASAEVMAGMEAFAAEAQRQGLGLGGCPEFRT